MIIVEFFVTDSPTEIMYRCLQRDYVSYQRPSNDVWGVFSGTEDWGCRSTIRWADIFKASGHSFSIPTPTSYYHFVSSKKDVKELSQARSSSLSLHAVSLEILQPKHTMCGVEWKNQRGIEGIGFVRVLKTELTSHLPYFLPRLSAMMELEAEKWFKKSEIGYGKKNSGTHSRY